MNFRIFASGVLLILVYQLAIAALAVWFVVHCEAARGESVRDVHAMGMTAGESG